MIPGVRRAVVAAGLVALSLASLARCGGQPALPNVLVLVMDTTRADRCSFMGYPQPTTPELAKFAKESVRFTDAWSSAPWTIPAHAALFSGRRPVRLGMVKPWTLPLPKDVTTLAEVLGGAGWRTGLFTCNAWIAEHSGLSQGFQTFEPVYLAPTGPTAREAHRRAIGWMKERRAAGERFFAFINDVEPHAPWNPPPGYAERFLPKDASPALADGARKLMFPQTMLMHLGFEPLTPELRQTVNGLYDGEVASLDEAIGRLFDEMRAAGMLDDTFVVVAGDHGEGLGDHAWLEHGMLLYRELLHVPLLVRPPGGTTARDIDEVVRLEDVFPTVLDACSVPIPAGIDALPLLRSGGEAPSGRIARANERVRLDYVEAIEKLKTVTAAVPLRVARRSVYDGRYHLIESDRTRVELFDVKADPGETRDVSASEPEVVAKLRALLDQE